MKVLVTEKISSDMRQAMYEIVLDGVHKFSVQTDENAPDENHLGHPNLEDIYDIPTLLRKAYEAGKRNEEFVVEREMEETY